MVTAELHLHKLVPMPCSGIYRAASVALNRVTESEPSFSGGMLDLWLLRSVALVKIKL